MNLMTNPINHQSGSTSTKILNPDNHNLDLMRLSLVFFALIDVAAHLFANPGATPIVSYWIDIETATYGLIAVVYLLGLRRYYLLPILFTGYNMTMYFLSGLMALPFGINKTPLLGHLQFAQYSFGRGLSLAAWLFLFIMGIVAMKKDPGSKLNDLLN
jgi:hypothetical protein